ncbi:ABC transporter substrate-binding protein [Actomonas aquatica]|uniref:ABC transporter substrate-binding protein n=1 Tax=Actomonas aquatica TaxID=2866162 RepID=A0ABZ1CB38_9BACT|nr:ABC transporter substrate-binding protein [Opitutus sp. WL0086]WRQ88888.1 ABC transporter substrate-binding protein [Opitutus sp. WL0086]
MTLRTLSSLARPVGLAVLGLVALSGCGGGHADETGESGLPKVTFQTDWYPQAEHGGYYQAVTSGYFADAGIEVDILPGGPGALATQKVATGRADFAMGRSDDVMLAVQEGMPIVIVCALMQHDPQALLLHEENPITSFAELDGKSIMTVPGSGWLVNLEATYDIDINIIPMNYGLAQFMSDKNFIQQCFVTNEPYYVRENGGSPKTMLLANSGYDPYRVIFTSRKYAEAHPDRVRAFINASIKGWETFLNGDATAAKALIASRNEAMHTEFMDFSIAAMKESQLVGGDPAKGERIGALRRSRLASMGDRLHELGILNAPMPVDRYVDFSFLPAELQPLVEQ